MKFSQLGFIRGLITILALTGLVNCSSGKRYGAEVNVGNNPSPTPYTFQPTPYYTPYTPAVTSTCANISATLTRVSPATASVAVGQEVVFQITVLNCNSYRIERLDGAPGATFSQSTVWYKKSFSYTIGSASEGIRIIPIASSGAEGTAINVTAAGFPVVPATDSGSSTAFACSAIPMPGSINVTVDANGNLTQMPPTVNFQISCNRSMKVMSLVGLAGPAISLSSLPSMPATTATVQVQVAQLYQNPVKFTVVDANDASIVKYQVGEVYLNPVAQVVAPSCTLTVDKPLANPGEQVLLTIQSQGNVQSATIAGYNVSPYGGQALKTVTGSDTILGMVYGPNGTSGQCQVSFSVNPVLIGINFEDYKDGDYNDVAICMTGLFQVASNTVVATADQIVNAQVYKASSCNHNVTVRVVNQYGAITWATSFESKNKPNLAIPFLKGSHLETIFDSSGCRDGSYGIGSEWVRHGNFCNNTGG